MLQRCLGYHGQRCGALVDVKPGASSRERRCTIHGGMVNRDDMARRALRRPDFRKDEARRTSVVEQWRAQHGDWCPGAPDLDHAAHHCTTSSGPLTADHLDPPGRGGHERGPLRVLCHWANSKRGHAA